MTTAQQRRRRERVILAASLATVVLLLAANGLQFVNNRTNARQDRTASALAKRTAAVACSQANSTALAFREPQTGEAFNHFARRMRAQRVTLEIVDGLGCTDPTDRRRRRALAEIVAALARRPAPEPTPHPHRSRPQLPGLDPGGAPIETTPVGPDAPPPTTTPTDTPTTTPTQGPQGDPGQQGPPGQPGNDAPPPDQGGIVNPNPACDLVDRLGVPLC